MKKYTNLEYALINLLGVCLGMDKVSYEERLNYAKAHDYKRKINRMKITDDAGTVDVKQAEMINSIYLFNDTKNGIGKLLMYIDMGCSGASLQEILTKFIGCDESIVGKAMRNCEILDLYNVLFQMYSMKCKEKKVKPTAEGFEDFTRKVLKKGIIPWFYNGEAEMKKIVGKDNFEIFREVYAHALPGSEGFRKATLEGWNSKAYSYAWNAPDGAQIEFAVLGDPTRQGINIDGMRIEYNLVENEPRPAYVDSKYKKGEMVRNEGTRCLGANMTHSIDGYCLREVVRRVHMSKGRALSILNACAKSEKIWTENEFMVRLFDVYMKQNVVSVRWLYLAEKDVCKLPSVIEEELRRIAENELGSKEFDIAVIHDAYGATVNHINRLRQTANDVLASLYKSTIVDYWNEQLGLDIPTMEYSEEVYEQIKNAEYLFN